MSIETHAVYKNFHTIKHPLVAQKLSELRSIDTAAKRFRELVDEISLLLLYEATKTIAIKTQAMQSPVKAYDGFIFRDDAPVILPIMRAGIGMVRSFLRLLPNAKVGHIGLFRDEATLEPHRYYFKIPEDSAKREFFICDPMLATGGSTDATIIELKKAKIKKITMICLVASPEGVARIFENHPEVNIYAASLDDCLNENGFIVPGLGDAGDRLFGTI